MTTATLKQIAADAGTSLAKDTLLRIQAGEIGKHDVESTAALLAAFVLGCCEDMRADGHGEADITLFRDCCVQGHRLAWATFRAGLAATQENMQ
jgi:hypothetical protein